VRWPRGCQGAARRLCGCADARHPATVSAAFGAALIRDSTIAGTATTASGNALQRGVGVVEGTEQTFRFGIVSSASDRAAAKRVKESNPRLKIECECCARGTGKADLSWRIRSANQLHARDDCKAFQECLAMELAR